MIQAGLFSAVLTAFNVESYQLLQPGPSDATVAVLEEISARLNSFTVSPPFVNSTHARIPHTPFQAPPSAVWINALWFSSLICSLASASITLIVKQWLHETVVGLSGTSREIARLRQHRLHGLIKWRVGTIIVALPTLLQLALVLFLVGMLILLWTLHSAVAVLTSILVAVLFTFFVVVTILPTVKWDCCYRSPQASAVYTAIRFSYDATRRSLDHFLGTLWRIDTKFRGKFDTTCLSHRLWLWIHTSPGVPTWLGREQVILAQTAGTLDHRTATTAYATSLSSDVLSRTHIVLSDLPWQELDSFIQDIWSECDRHSGGPSVKADHCHHREAHIKRAQYLALHAASHMAAVAYDDRDEYWGRCTSSILRRLPAFPESDFQCSLEDYISTVGSIALGNDSTAWLASDKLAAYCLVLYELDGVVVSYSAIRHGSRSSLYITVLL